MPAPKGNKFAVGNPGGGRKTGYDEKYINIAKKLCQFGATDQEIADALGIAVRTIYAWKSEHQEFAAALKSGKYEADNRVERSLYARATGYEHDEVDIRVIEGQLVKTPIRKYYPPDTAAMIFWLKNRNKDEWRDKIDHELAGKDGGPIKLTITPNDADL